MIAARLESGEHAEVVAISGEIVSIVSPRAFAPGAPLGLTALFPDDALALSGKSLGSKRRPDGRFDVRARLVNLRRDDRTRLAESLT